MVIKACVGKLEAGGEFTEFNSRLCLLFKLVGYFCFPGPFQKAGLTS